jgi:hypothetical protein
MISIVRTSQLSLQHDIHKQKNAAEKIMRDELNNLKRDYVGNANRIFYLERVLSELTEEKLKDELANYKIFDRLNNEKITPFFMRLARAHNQNDDIEKIKSDTGTKFEDKKGHEDYVTNFYQTLYSKAVNDIQVTEADINNFLGPISNNENVLNSKISEAEKTLLDSPLSLYEFDKAINTCNKKSAPGTDGISNRFIVK